jgi:alpha-1,6-mannosyltransferase
LFQILLAVVASTVIVVLLIALTYRHLPWRAMPVEDADESHHTADIRPPATRPSQPRTPPVKPDAYAESP